MYGCSTELFDQSSTILCLAVSSCVLKGLEHLLCLLSYNVCLAHICAVSRFQLSVLVSADRFTFSLLQGELLEFECCSTVKQMLLSFGQFCRPFHPLVPLIYWIYLYRYRST